MTGWGDVNYASGLIVDLRKVLDTCSAQMFLTKTHHCETYWKPSERYKSLNIFWLITGGLFLSKTTAETY